MEFAYDSGLCHLSSISKNLTSHNTKQLVFKRVLGLSSNMSFKREHAYNRVALKKKTPRRQDQQWQMKVNWNFHMILESVNRCSHFGKNYGSMHQAGIAYYSTQQCHSSVPGTYLHQKTYMRTFVTAL